MNQEFEIYTSNASDDPLAAFLLERLIDYNDSQVKRDKRPFVIALKRGGDVMAGADCISMYDWMHVKLLWVKASARKFGYGTKLMKLIEDEAIARKCRGIHLDTFSFQAKDFYLKLGFKIFGEIKDHPKGHDRYYLHKIINPGDQKD